MTVRAKQYRGVAYLGSRKNPQCGVKPGIIVTTTFLLHFAQKFCICLQFFILVSKYCAQILFSIFFDDVNEGSLACSSPSFVLWSLSYDKIEVNIVYLQSPEFLDSTLVRLY